LPGLLLAACGTTLIYGDKIRVNVAIFFNEEFYGHVQDPFHPESPERLRGIVHKLQEHGLWKDVLSSKTGQRDLLKLVHEDDYIDFIETCGECSLTMDTRVHHETYHIASLSAQCAVDAVMHSKENGRPTFALTRPPGHHSGPNYGMGFCYFNNISIAARHLQRNGDRRIAIVDMDVHHGNGTEQIFAEDPTVLYISTHQTGIFPGTGRIDFMGKGEGLGFTINVPLASGCGDSTFDLAYKSLVCPVLELFNPDVLLISVGVDNHYRDPLASLSLSSDGHVRQAKQLLDFAKSKCGGRATLMLEGGYDIPALSEVVAGIIGLMEGSEIPLEFTDIVDSSCLGRGTVERCMRNASEHWDL
jgi:acetoin utilization deacetylase AcuC-like enzyme